MVSMLSGVALVSVRTQVCARAQSVSKTVAIAELVTVAAKACRADEFTLCDFSTARSEFEPSERAAFLSVLQELAKV